MKTIKSIVPKDNEFLRKYDGKVIYKYFNVNRLWCVDWKHDKIGLYSPEVNSMYLKLSPSGYRRTAYTNASYHHKLNLNSETSIHYKSVSQPMPMENGFCFCVVDGSDEYQFTKYIDFENHETYHYIHIRDWVLKVVCKQWYNDRWLKNIDSAFDPETHNLRYFTVEFITHKVGTGNVIAIKDVVFHKSIQTLTSPIRSYIIDYTSNGSLVDPVLKGWIDFKRWVNDRNNGEFGSNYNDDRTKGWLAKAYQKIRKCPFTYIDKNPDREPYLLGTSGNNNANFGLKIHEWVNFFQLIVLMEFPSDDDNPDSKVLDFLGQTVNGRTRLQNFIRHFDLQSNFHFKYVKYDLSWKTHLPVANPSSESLTTLTNLNFDYTGDGNEVRQIRENFSTSKCNVPSFIYAYKNNKLVPLPLGLIACWCRGTDWKGMWYDDFVNKYIENF